MLTLVLSAVKSALFWTMATLRTCWNLCTLPAVEAGSNESLAATDDVACAGTSSMIDQACIDRASPAHQHDVGTIPQCDDAVLRVVVGTSNLAAEDPSLTHRIADVANRANGYQRFSLEEVAHRLAMGDSEPNANRVLHVAFLDGTPVGCCSSTPGWGRGGSGHWGALAVDPGVQGKGIASALVDAAEERLLAHGCTSVRIEYHYDQGDPESERLRAWYEGKLGFSGSGGGFRFASKKLSAAAIAERRRKRAAGQSTMRDVLVSDSNKPVEDVRTEGRDTGA